jgi:hypothetical protein
VPSMCNVVHYSLVFSLLDTTCFGLMWPSSGVQVVMVKDSAAHCNAVFFPPIVVASGYFWLCGLPLVNDVALRRHKTLKSAPKLVALDNCRTF